MTPADFASLPRDDVEALGRFATRRTYPAGTTLFRQGELPTRLSILERGAVELVHGAGAGRFVVQFVHPGSSVGQLAILLDSPYPYSAVALSEATLLHVRLDAVQALEELFPEIAFRWLRLLAHSLDRAHGRILELAGRSALEQVSHLLLHESAERGQPTLDVTQEELAATLGLSRQTVSRAYRQLALEGAIRAERRRVRVLDPGKLREHVPRREASVADPTVSPRRRRLVPGQ